MSVIRMKYYKLCGESLLHLFTIFISLSCVGQERFCDSIPWSDVRQLRWSDFRGIPDSTSHIGALSHISFKYRLEREKNKITLTAVTFFQPCDSWVDTTAAGGLSLAHEQTHFDIDEFIRRSFVKEIADRHSYTEKQLVRNYQHQYFLSFLSRQIMHKMYDLETDYHRNPLEQNRWNDEVATMLASLRQYSATVFEWNFPY